MHISPARSLLRAGYRQTISMVARIAAGDARKNAPPGVFYGGARAGDFGGPLVKVKRLMTRFPEIRWRYNLIYLLSGAPYLTAGCLAALKRRGIPIICNQNGTYHPAWFSGDCDKQNAEMAAGYHAADHVFYQSGFCQRAAERFLGPRTGPGEILHNAVDTALFKPAGQASDNESFRFLTSGKIQRHLFYRLESTLKGLAHARKHGLDATLIIAGSLDAETTRKAHELTNALSLDEAVSFIGPYSQSAAPDIYRKADAYVTTTHQDACPNAVIEALASGLPVVYSASGGTPELVGDDAGIGLAVEEDWQTTHVPNAEAVGDAMLGVAENASVMAVAARARAVDLFDIEHWLDRHEAIFRQLLETRR